jgi:hypothetical protein
LLKAETADGSPISRSKNTREKEHEVQSNGLSPEKYVKISVGSADTPPYSVRTRNRVRIDVSNNPDTPVPQVRTRKRGQVDVEVELRSSPLGTRNTLRSKGNVGVESVVKENVNDSSVFLPSVRKTRGTKLAPAVEILSCPASRKRGAEGAVDAKSSPVSSRRQQGATAKTKTVESSPTSRRQVAAVTADDKPLPPRRKRHAIVPTETVISESPVTRKTRGKSTLKSVVTSPPAATAVPLEDSFTSANKQLTAKASPLTAGKRQKRGTEAVEQPIPKPARKLRGAKLPGEFYDMYAALGLGFSLPLTEMSSRNGKKKKCFWGVEHIWHRRLMI